MEGLVEPRIAGVELRPLRQIVDERGKVMHMLRSDAEHFRQFGEIYFSWINPGVVKAWNRHRLMTLNYAVPVGNVRVVLYDERQDSATRGSVMEIELGESRYALLTIPPGLWTGFQSLDAAPAMIANCATLPHDPGEVERREWRSPDVPYDWRVG